MGVGKTTKPAHRSQSLDSLNKCHLLELCNCDIKDIMMSLRGHWGENTQNTQRGKEAHEGTLHSRSKPLAEMSESATVIL